MGSGFKFSPGCCCTSCSVESDDFNRADSTILGAKWTEVVNNSTISSNALVVPGTGLQPIGIALCNTTAANNDSIRMSADIVGGDGVTARFFFKYIDSSNYHYVDYTFQSVGSATLAIGKVVAGANTTLEISGVTNSGNAASLTLCHSRNIATAYVDTPCGQSLSAYVANDATTTGVVALGTGSIGNVTFDNFVFEYAYEPDENPGCATCDCLECVMPSEVVIDLGAGGWTDDGCGFCGEASGEIHVPLIIGAVSSTECSAGNCVRIGELCDYCGDGSVMVGLYLHVSITHTYGTGYQIDIGISTIILTGGVETFSTPGNCPDGGIGADDTRLLQSSVDYDPVTVTEADFFDIAGVDLPKNFFGDYHNAGLPLSCSPTRSDTPCVGTLPDPVTLYAI